MRKVISNTTPILSLLKINKLSVLRDLYGEIYIPFAVYEEIENGKDKSYYQNLKNIDWIKIQKIKSESSRFYFMDLDKGEAEVLILANEMGADLVIIDEVLGRRYAKKMELNLTGTLGILLKAKQKGLLSQIQNLLIELQEKGSWFNPQLIEKVLQLANEKND